MRKFTLRNDETLVVGTAREIKSLYKNMVKRDFFPLFTNEPKFNMCKMYGISYSGGATDYSNGIMVVNENTICELLANGEIK